MPRRGGKEPRAGRRGRMGGLGQALVMGGSQVANPEGSSRGPKNLRIGRDAMRSKMKGK